MKIKEKVILFFSNYLPLKICIHALSKSENLKKKYFIFFELSPFADLDFENL